MILIRFTVWCGYFSQYFSGHYILKAKKVHACWATFTQTKVPHRTPNTWSLYHILTRHSRYWWLTLSIFVLFLCWFNSLHLECFLFTSLYCLKSLLSFNIHLCQTLHPRSYLGWPNFRPRDNFAAITSPCDNGSQWKILIQRVLREHQRKRSLAVAASS